MADLLKMKVTLRQKLGTLILDIPRYAYLVVIGKLLGRNDWLKYKNRNETIFLNPDTEGVRCQGQWTSNLHLTQVFPSLANHLYKLCTKHCVFKFTALEPRLAEHADVTFIIGHRGTDRLPLLLKTIDSIGSQGDCAVECIVVEQSAKASIKDKLPKWVRFYHQEVPQEQAYSRSMAFNFGAKLAQTEHIILHDNDLLVPTRYASDHLKWLRKGYQFVNLKRFIFYLNKESSQGYIKDHHNNTFSFDQIMQNAQGGGSIAASKTAYFDIGGFDEQFVGWGGEDNEFWERAQTKKTWAYANLCLIHLWHKPQIDKQMTDASANKKRYETLSRIEPHDRIATLKASYSSD